MRIPAKNQRRVFTRPVENESVMRKIIIAIQKYGFGGKIAYTLGQFRIIKSTQMVCAGVSRLIRHEFARVSLQQGNVPLYFGAETAVNLRGDAEVPKVKDSHVHTATSGQTLQPRRDILNGVRNDNCKTGH